MSKSVFISYSRQEVPFVDILLEKLEEHGIQTWLDYRSLVPGKPWLEQILAGIDGSDVLLLVVSNASITSPNVQLEYKRALEKNKRIMLIIFEATVLPTELQNCEWIDFRGSFRKGVGALLRGLDQPFTYKKAIPQHGFKTSFTVWFTFLLAILVVLISIPAWWTLFIPALLIPLPVRILKRNYQYYRVRFALITLPVTLILSWTFFKSYPFLNYPISYCIFASFVLCPWLLILLSSTGMRTWGKPGASIPRRGKRYRLEAQRPEPMPFFIEYAPADEKYAQAIIKGLTRHGHPQVAEVAQTNANFVIISRYQNEVSIDPQKHVVYPIIIQDVPVDDPDLQRIQWIDFRAGLKNLDKLAHLLSQPEKLLKALGVVPISRQVIYPRIIQIIDYYLILLGFFTCSVWIPLSLEFGRQFIQLDNFILFVTVNIILTALILWSVFVSRQALVTRTGKNASLGRLIASLLWVGLINFIQTWSIIFMVIAATELTGIKLEQDLRGSVTLFLPLSFSIGFILIVVLGIFNWRDLTRWFPQKIRKEK
jgi:hypothetical protein